MGKYKDLMFKVATIVIVLASLAMVLIIYISLEWDVKENDRKSVILITPNKTKKEGAVVDDIKPYNFKWVYNGVLAVDSESIRDYKIENIISQMTLEEKVAQMFFVGIDGISGVKGTTALNDDIKKRLEKFPVGGIIIFGKNISGKEQLKKLKLFSGHTIYSYIFLIFALIFSNRSKANIKQSI